MKETDIAKLAYEVLKRLVYVWWTTKGVELIPAFQVLLHHSQHTRYLYAGLTQ